MQDNATEHALTEVALALAMAFFAIMILAMVSMSVPSEAAKPVTKPATKPVTDKPVTVPLPEQTVQLTDSSEKATATDPKGANSDHPTYVFYFNGQYYDQQLTPIDLNALGQDGKVVLALPPSLTMDKAMDIQAQINRADLVITQLNPQWLQRLEDL